MGECVNKISIILVNYNGKKFLKDCINSIESQTYKNLSVIVVDNCSEDESVSFLRREYPAIEVITCKENTGFAKGNNIGIMYALKHEADYILLLNVDTIIDTCLVERLIEVADQKTVTVPKIYSNRAMTRIWYGGGKIDYDKGCSYHLFPKRNDDRICEVSFACGCCMLIHKDILTKTGLFDEKYYLYFEDTDLSVRFGIKNIKIKYVPEARMWHKVGGSRGKKGKYMLSYYLTRNQLYFIKKYQDKIKIKVLKKVLDIFIKDILLEPDKEMRRYIRWGIQDFYRNNMYELGH